MKRRPAGARRRCLARGLLLTAIALAPGGSGADEAVSRELRGACYCRVQRELMCTADLTVRECELRSTHAFCDEWSACPAGTGATAGDADAHLDGC
jgi:hypothetical protein